jgi:hypothetical protein
MSDGTHLELHREHWAWVSEAELWCDEVALWRAEAESALAEAERRVESLRDDLQMLAAHEESVRAHMGRSRGYEHAVAEFEAGGRTDDLLVNVKRHRGEAARHAACHQTHAEVKNLHHAVMREHASGNSMTARA